MKKITLSEIEQLERELAAAQPAEVAPLVKKLVKARHLFVRQSEK